VNTKQECTLPVLAPVRYTFLLHRGLCSTSTGHVPVY